MCRLAPCATSTSRAPSTSRYCMLMLPRSTTLDCACDRHCVWPRQPTLHAVTTHDLQHLRESSFMQQKRAHRLLHRQQRKSFAGQTNHARARTFRASADAANDGASTICGPTVTGSWFQVRCVPPATAQPQRRSAARVRAVDVELCGCGAVRGCAFSGLLARILCGVLDRRVNLIDLRGQWRMCFECSQEARQARSITGVSATKLKHRRARS